MGARGHKVKSTATNGNKKKYVSALLSAMEVNMPQEKSTITESAEEVPAQIGINPSKSQPPNAPPKYFNVTQLLDAQAELVAKVKKKVNELESHKDILSMKIKLQGAKVKACKENLQESMDCQGNN
jgi:cell envelope opacity-associated protein A